MICICYKKKTNWKQWFSKDGANGSPPFRKTDCKYQQENFSREADCNHLDQ